MRRGPGPAFAKVMDDQHASSAPEAYFRVAIWLGKQRKEPTTREIEDKFNVHRATACRWLNAWRSAMGVV